MSTAVGIAFPLEMAKVRMTEIEPKVLLAAVGFLDDALADLDYLRTAKAKLLEQHPEWAPLMYADALRGLEQLRGLLGLESEREPISWEAIP
jgi:hypothetical protein